jgi:hypothetical protein
MIARREGIRGARPNQSPEQTGRAKPAQSGSKRFPARAGCSAPAFGGRTRLLMASVVLQDVHRPARVTFAWERPAGFKSPLIRVGLQHAEELNVSALILPGVRRPLLRFLENLSSLDAEGAFEERTVRGAELEFELYCRPGSRGVIVCEVSLAADWDDQRWRAQVRLDLEASRLPGILARFRDFFDQEA